jgi:hypothetical protein
VTEFSCTSVGTASTDCQIPLVADVGTFEMQPLEGEKERKRVERRRIDSLVPKLATVAVPIDANPYNNNPSMQEHSWYLRDRAASSSIFYEISMD